MDVKINSPKNHEVKNGLFPIYNQEKIVFANLIFSTPAIINNDLETLCGSLCIVAMTEQD